MNLKISSRWAVKMNPFQYFYFLRLKKGIMETFPCFFFYSTNTLKKTSSNSFIQLPCQLQVYTESACFINQDYNYTGVYNPI